MANYTQLIQTINDNIKANGNQEITGPVLNAVLQAIVNGLSQGALFAGIATTATNPGTPDGNVFYIAIEPGTYSNFGVIVPNGSIGIISNTSNDWKVKLINIYYEIDVDTLMQDSPSSDDIDEAIGSFTHLKRAITLGVPIFGRGASGGNSTVAIAQVKKLSDTEVRVVMLNTGTVDGSNELVPIIKKITNSAGQLSLSTEAPTSFIGPLSSLNTTDKGSVVEAINEIDTGLKSTVKPYVVDLTDLLTAQDSESISTAIGGIDNLNGTVKKNQVIFGTLANGTVAVGIRVLGNKTTLTYFVDSVVGLTVNEIIITNTDGTLSKTANTHAVLTENMVVNSLESDETTLPLSAAQGKALKEDVKTTYQKITDNTLATTDKTVTGAINEVNQAVKTKQDKLKAGTGVEITSDNTVNVTLDTTVFKVVASLPESPAAGDENKIHLVPAESTEEGNIYTEYVFVNGKWEEFGTYRSEVDLTPYLKKEDAEATYQKMTDSTLATANKTVVGAINEVKSSVDVNSYMQYLHKVYEEYGAVYNAETGYWEMYGLTDLTEEDMWDIYVENIGVSFGNQSNDEYILRLWPFKKARIRFIRIEDAEYSHLSGFVFCMSHNTLEVFRCVDPLNAEVRLRLSGRCTGIFFGCINLKDAGIINVSLANILIDSNIRAFNNCIKLNRILLKNLKVDISFQDSPLLSYESLNYLVTNAANTAAITVTVHPTTYSYLTGTAQPTEEVGGTTEEWQALVTTAQAKQISFAVPEETQSEVTE